MNGFHCGGFALFLLGCMVWPLGGQEDFRPVSPQALRQDALKILDQQFPGHHWKIHCLLDGKILVSGMACNLEQKQAVSLALSNLPGCKSVGNQLLVPGDAMGRNGVPVKPKKEEGRPASSQTPVYAPLNPEMNENSLGPNENPFPTPLPSAVDSRDLRTLPMRTEMPKPGLLPEPTRPGENLNSIEISDSIEQQSPLTLEETPTKSDSPSGNSPIWQPVGESPNWRPTPKILNPSPRLANPLPPADQGREDVWKKSAPPPRLEKDPPALPVLPGISKPQKNTSLPVKTAPVVENKNIPTPTSSEPPVQEKEIALISLPEKTQIQRESIEEVRQKGVHLSISEKEIVSLPETAPVQRAPDRPRASITSISEKLSSSGPDSDSREYLSLPEKEAVQRGLPPTAKTLETISSISHSATVLTIQEIRPATESLEIISLPEKKLN